jgi:hypothetical protein
VKGYKEWKVTILESAESHWEIAPSIQLIIFFAEECGSRGARLGLRGTTQLEVVLLDLTCERGRLCHEHLSWLWPGLGVER